MGEHWLFGARERRTLEHRGGHIVSGTYGRGEPVVEVPDVTDGQQDDTDISVARGESERSVP